MKKNYLILLLTILFISCDNSQNKSKTNVQADSKLPVDSTEMYIQDNDIKEIKTKGLLVCDKSKMEYGVLSKGNDIDQKFNFINTGTEDVEIIAYQASCNCTELKIDDYIVKPNDSTKITMVIETHDKSFGDHTVTATIKTNGQRKFYLLTTNFTLQD
ncbi:unnamed protein product [Ectocarpus fasciculatus]